MHKFQCEDCGAECDVDPSGLYAYCHVCRVRWDLLGPEIKDGLPPMDVVQ